MPIILALALTSYCDLIGARLDLAVNVEEFEARVTFLPFWGPPPDWGWLSDGGPAEPINQAIATPASSIIWSYPRRSEDTERFGFLSVTEGPERCDLRVDFVVPALQSPCPDDAPPIGMIRVVAIPSASSCVVLRGSVLAIDRDWCHRQGWFHATCAYGNDRLKGGREQREACEADRGPYIWRVNGELCDGRNSACRRTADESMTYFFYGPPVPQLQIEVCAGGGSGPCFVWACDRARPRDRQLFCEAVFP